MRTPDSAQPPGIVALPTTVEALRDNMPPERLRQAVNLALDNIRDGVVMVDTSGKVLLWNTVAERLLGRGPVITSPEHWAELYGVYHLDGVTLYAPDELPLARAMAGEEVVNYELLLRPGNGSESRLLRGRATPLYDGEQQVGAITAFHDATEYDELLRRVRYRSLHDHKTGAQNGASICETIDAMLGELEGQDGSGFGVLLLNLDRFGLTNSIMGRAGADGVLRRVARLLMQRDQTIAVGRLCADEFVLITAAADLGQVQREANQIIFALRSLDLTPAHVGYQLTASVGASWLGAGAVSSADELLAHLTHAVEDAKADGRNRSVPIELGAASPPHLHGGRVNDIIRALDEDRICLFAEPIVREGGGIAALEILTRLRDDQGDLSLPRHFLQTAERFGLIAQIDIRNLSSLLRWMRQRVDNRQTLPRMHINLSSQTLIASEHFRDWMSLLIEHVRLAQQITVEVTETFAMRNPAESAMLLQQIRELGCRVALDDFGAGYSSLSQLKLLPLDYLKIDGSLVRNVLDDPQDRAILDTVIRLGKALDLPLIAEHAATAAHVDALFAMGVDFVQGYGADRGAPLD